ncbi:MAG: anti-sigma factor [Candidatus Dormibacteria bacterium]
MSHLNDGVLRRMQDEPATTSAADAVHLEACDDCRRRAATVRADAEGVSSLLAMPDQPVEPAVALLRLRRLVMAEPTPRQGATAWLNSLRRRRAFRPVAASAITVALMAALVATGVADGFIQTFQPQHFAAVSVDPTSLSSLPDISQFGSYLVDQAPAFKSSPTAPDVTLGTSARHLLVPGPLPASVTGVPTYESFSNLKGHFTFDLAKARVYEASRGKTLPAPPNGVNGTTLTLTAGPGVITVYGAPTAADEGVAPRSRGGRMSIPSLAIVQMNTPTVVSNGAPVSVLENYLAGLPGVPPELATSIRNLGNPATTLPVPVPTGQGSESVNINNHTQGLFVGDSTGLGAGVIWQEQGVVYAVVGTLTKDGVVSVARGLHS